MPWVDIEKCTGCEVCVEECPVGAILMEDEKSKINMEICIHCGICHDVCPQEAIRHDSERIPEVVKDNIEETKGFMEACAKYLGDVKEKEKCLMRMIKHFRKEKIIVEKTLEELEKIKNAQSL